VGGRLVAAWLLLALPAGIACRGEPRPPDLVLISIDTLRQTALRAYDGDAPALPNLDAFAAQSVRFARAVSTASWTLPAHASLVTGLYPDRHGATDPRVTLAQDASTLAQALAARGYQTAGFVDGGFLRREYGFARGFESYDDERAPDAATPADATRSVLDRAAAMLARRRDPRPLFLFVHTYSLHDYFLLRPWAVEAVHPARGRGEYMACLTGAAICEEDDWRTLRLLYAAELRQVDASFGRLRDALVAAGSWDAGVVVLTSDHGEGFDPARGRTHHGGRLHEDVLRVPLLVRGAGFEPRVVADPVSLVDVMPTLLELAGARPPASLDGRSFAGALRGRSPDADPRPLYAEESYYSWWSGTRMQSSEVRARPHAIAVIEGDRWYLRSAAGEELYDLASDPRQAHDLVAQAADLPALRALAAARERDRPDTPTRRGDEELEQQLEALGYAQ
jgi:arylsulfatase A-like enzyme